MGGFATTAREITSNLFSKFHENLANPKLEFDEIFSLNQGNDVKIPYFIKSKPKPFLIYGIYDLFMITEINFYIIFM